MSSCENTFSVPLLGFLVVPNHQLDYMEWWLLIFAGNIPLDCKLKERGRKNKNTLIKYIWIPQLQRQATITDHKMYQRIKMSTTRWSHDQTFNLQISLSDVNGYFQCFELIRHKRHRRGSVVRSLQKRVGRRIKHVGWNV